MTTTPAPAPHPAPSRRHPARALSAGGAVLLVAAFTQGCASGRVMSEAEFRGHLRQTEAAGREAVRQLGADPAATVDRRSMDDSSCKDDLGLDSEGVTRDQPSVTWAPGLSGPAAYEAALAKLRTAWSARGLEVEEVPAPATGRPGAGLRGIRTTDGHGVGLSLRPDWYSGDPVLRADGGCVRHHGYLARWE
ncbi:hypothetical protein ACGFXC_27495 [Streptomyces sp. NPDC048507]|uniref:hypothetical protein n=1 Tax=Streptomyces sp. NPDC048507 TaxID=3365560 RepID=UPI00371C469C